MGPDRPTVTKIVEPHGTWLVNGGANFLFSNMGPDRPGAGWVLGPHGFGAGSTVTMTENTLVNRCTQVF